MDQIANREQSVPGDIKLDGIQQAIQHGETAMQIADAKISAADVGGESDEGFIEQHKRQAVRTMAEAVEVVLIRSQLVNARAEKIDLNAGR